MENFDVDKITTKWLGFTLFLLRVTGMWPMKGAHKNQLKMFIFYVELLFSVFVLVIFYLAIIPYIIVIINDAESVIKALPLVFAYAEVAVRVYIVGFGRKRVQKVPFELEKSYRKTAGDSECKEIWDSTIKLSNTTSKILFGCVTCATSMYWWSPLFPTENEYMSDAFNSTTNESMILLIPPNMNASARWPIPFQVYLPFEINSSRIYVAVYLSEVLLMIRLVGIWISTDCLVLTLMILIAGELKVLNTLLKKLHLTAKTLLLPNQVAHNGRRINVNTLLKKVKHSSKINLPLPHFKDKFLFGSYVGLSELKQTKLPDKIEFGIENEDISVDSGLEENSEDLNTEMETLLHECIEFHHSIVKTVQDLQDILGPIMLLQFLMNAIIICLTLYKGISSSELTIMSAVQFTSFFCCICLDLYLFCKFGEEIISESSRIRESLFECGWYTSSNNLKKKCFIMMERSKKPLCIKAGPFYDISLETFKKFMNAAYSFYTLIRQVNSEATTN